MVDPSKPCYLSLLMGMPLFIFWLWNVLEQRLLN